MYMSSVYLVLSLLRLRPRGCPFAISFQRIGLALVRRSAAHPLGRGGRGTSVILLDVGPARSVLGFGITEKCLWRS